MYVICVLTAVQRHLNTFNGHSLQSTRTLFLTGIKFNFVRSFRITSYMIAPQDSSLRSSSLRTNLARHNTKCAQRFKASCCTCTRRQADLTEFHASRHCSCKPCVQPQQQRNRLSQFLLPQLCSRLGSSCSQQLFVDGS